MPNFFIYKSLSLKADAFKPSFLLQACSVRTNFVLNLGKPSET